MDIALWGKVAKEAVSRFASSATKEDKEDYEQECLLEILKCEPEITTILNEQGQKNAQNYVYGLCRHKISNTIRNNKKDALQHTDDWVHARVMQNPVGCGMEGNPERGFGILPVEYAMLSAQHCAGGQGVTELQLDAAVKKLPRTEQHIIRCYFFHKKTEQEIATEMQKNRWWVQQVKKRAVKMLQEFLEV